MTGQMRKPSMHIAWAAFSERQIEMIQDILPYRMDNHYIHKQPDAGDYIIFVQTEKVLYKTAEHLILLPQYGNVPVQNLDLTYLFSVSGCAFYLADCQEPEDNTTPLFLTGLYTEGYNFQPVEWIRKCQPKWLCFAAATAFQLSQWYQKNRFCGQCGSLLLKDTVERKLICPSCPNSIYPPVCPAVIVGVMNHDRILMTEYADAARTGQPALIAGFAEIGETIEDTVRREVMEETGIHIKNIQYYKSQPWAFSNTLLFGFFCELDGAEEITMDCQELSVAKWVAREEISLDWEDISLTNEMIRTFKNNQ